MRSYSFRAAMGSACALLAATLGLAGCASDASSTTSVSDSEQYPVISTSPLTTPTSEPTPSPKPKRKTQRPSPAPEPEAATGDDLFLSRFNDGTMPGIQAAFTDPVSVAHAVCGDWNNGVAWEGIFANFSDHDAVEAAYFMASAGEAYCPSLYRYMESRLN